MLISKTNIILLLSGICLAALWAYNLFILENPWYEGPTWYMIVNVIFIMIFGNYLGKAARPFFH